MGNLEELMHYSRRAQLTLFDSLLVVIQPAALVLVGASVVNLDNKLYAGLLFLAMALLVFVQYSLALRNQSDRSRELFTDYIQNRSNLLTVLTSLATYSNPTKRLTKTSLLIAVETWFEEDLLQDYYLEQDEGFKEHSGITFRKKPFWKRWTRQPVKELTYVWYRTKARLRSQPILELIDIVYHTPNEDIVSMVITRALEEDFIEERLVAGDVPQNARIEYVWSVSVVSGNQPTP